MTVKLLVPGEVEHALEADGPDHLLLLLGELIDETANREDGEAVVHRDDVAAIVVVLKRRRGGHGAGIAVSTHWPSPRRHANAS